jgi:2-methylisocitrate lyase-like PEP mutase family enzyme
MPNQFSTFHSLHHQNSPLLIANAWNVPTAKVFEQLKYKAIATSSAAVAESLGYSDGETMPFDNYILIAKRIVASVAVPVSVDIEGGYGKTVEEIAANITALANIGVSGVNIEDSTLSEGKRVMSEPNVFADKMKSIATILDTNGVKVFINLRTDSFLIGVPDTLKDALKRIAVYNDCGVHGIFVPCITKPDDIKACTATSNLPINVMCMPDLPDFKQLGDAGVKRVSMGPFPYRKVYKMLEGMTEEVLKDGNFKAYF